MIYKTETHDLEVNGIKIAAVVTIEVEEDFDIQIEDDIAFDDKDTERVYIERFKRGELFIGCIRVTAQALGLEGYDSLGGCHLYTNNYFDSAAFERSVNETMVDHQMIENALSDLEREILTQANELKQFA